MADKDNNFFWITTEERAKVVQQQLAQLVIASYDQEENVVNNEKLSILKKVLLDTLSNELYSYAPQKTINSIKQLINNTDNLTNTPIGELFKKIAR